jgi:hypothetical protein
MLRSNERRFRAMPRSPRLCLVLLATAALGLAVTLGAGGAAGAGGDPALPPTGDILVRDSYNLTDTPLDSATLPNAPPGNGSTLLWGYEAAVTGARILSYDIGPSGTGPLSQLDSCIPTHMAGVLTSQDGRGLAFDPLDGNLWNTQLLFPQFSGDGYIHKNTPPPDCMPVTDIPFGDGPGGMIQDDIGALDVDQGSKHIWAAGYFPISVGGGPPRNYFYLVNRNNGKIIQSCFIVATSGEPFNDTLTYARLKGVPGSGQDLVTDGGEFDAGDPLKVIDTSSCHNGRQATIVATIAKSRGMTGIDFEWLGLINADGSNAPFTQNLYNNFNYPWATSTVLGNTNTEFGLEDISLCAFRAKFGGDGNDMCFY